MKSKLRKRTMVEIITMRLSDGEFTDNRILNFDDKDARDWLLKHTSWAIHHGHGVQVSPLNGPVQAIASA